MTVDIQKAGALLYPSRFPEFGSETTNKVIQVTKTLTFAVGAVGLFHAGWKLIPSGEAFMPFLFFTGGGLCGVAAGISAGRLEGSLDVPNRPLPPPPSTALGPGVDPFGAAFAYADDPEIFARMIERVSADALKKHTIEGRTLLHIATLEATPASVSRILAKGADPHKRDNEGKTAAFYAGRLCDGEKLDRLLDTASETLMDDAIEGLLEVWDTADEAQLTDAADVITSYIDSESERVTADNLAQSKEQLEKHLEERNTRLAWQRLNTTEALEQADWPEQVAKVDPTGEGPFLRLAVLAKRLDRVEELLAKTHNANPPNCSPTPLAIALNARCWDIALELLVGEAETEPARLFLPGHRELEKRLAQPHEWRHTSLRQTQRYIIDAHFAGKKCVDDLQLNVLEIGLAAQEGEVCERLSACLDKLC